MCRSGTQVELPRRLAMSQVGLVDDHTLHQPCVQSLSFTSTLALWMPTHWAPSLWPTVAIPQRKKWHLPGGRITSGDLPLRTHGRTHTHKHAYNKIDISPVVLTMWVSLRLAPLHRSIQKYTESSSMNLAVEQ